ncbi:hypothetical protein ACFL5H_00215 [Candidatus Latescibacterota bacterium]
MGPAYVCLPQNVLDESVDYPVELTFLPSTRCTPDAALVEEAARMLTLH